jgi:hypothetical protein
MAFWNRPKIRKMQVSLLFESLVKLGWCSGPTALLQQDSNDLLLEQVEKGAKCAVWSRLLTENRGERFNRAGEVILAGVDRTDAQGFPSS